MNFFSKRSSGVLLHLTSLPGKYPTGGLGENSLAFIDFLKRSGQSCWQFLPLGPTSPAFGNSPYMVSSTHAGNPLLIDPDTVAELGLTTPKNIAVPFFSEYQVDFPHARAFQEQFLQTTWTMNRGPKTSRLLSDFADRQPWLEEYALFMVLKQKFNQKAWFQWPRQFRSPTPSLFKRIRGELAAEMHYFMFEQFLFFSQWQRLKNHAHKQSIQLIGDLPIYVSEDSADVWANQEIFELDSVSGKPTHVAGVPPDYFSKTGQRWGNPLYRWNSTDQTIQSKLEQWWSKRLATLFSLVDIVRIDHFRGFESYWSVPADKETAMDGSWKHGPGKKFFDTMERKLGPLNIIAEDLGIITPAVEALRDELGYPGMKILQFAFDSNPDNAYLPHNHSSNSIVYTGTHDNDTVVGWYFDPSVSISSKQQAKRYANRKEDNATSIHHDFIHMAMASVATLSMFPLQDLLGFGGDCRMNMPGTSKGNWTWRCASRFLTEDLEQWLHEQTRFFNRLPSPPKKDSTQTNE